MTETTGSVVSDWTTAYDGAGLATSATNAVGGESLTYTHDGVGDLTVVNSSINANDRAYTYDAFSRLTCAKAAATSCGSGSTRVLLTLDALDRTYQRTYNSSVTNAWYRGIAEVPVKTQVGSGTPTTYATTGAGQSLGEKTGSTALYHLRDTHGDVVGLVSTSGTNQGTAAFDPWGRTLATSGTQSWFRYQGDPTDPVSGLVDMVSRWYSPTAGRFTSRNVLFGEVTSPMSLNLLAYAQMNPVSGTDPTGMMLQCRYCSSQERTELARSYAAGVSSVKAPPPPEPAPPIVYGPHTVVGAAAKLVREYADEALKGSLNAVEGAILGAVTVVERAGLYGRLLRTGDAAQRTRAARLLPKFGGSGIDDLVRSPWGSRVTRLGGRAIPAVAAGLDFWSNLREGDSVPEAMAKTAGGLAGGWAGAWAGGAAGCSIGPWGCLGGAIVGGIAGSGAGSWIVDKLTDLL